MSLCGMGYQDGDRIVYCDLEEGHDPETDPAEVVHEFTEKYEYPTMPDEMARISSHTMKWKMGDPKDWVKVNDPA